MASSVNALAQPGRSPTILVVDDDPSIREVLSRMLRHDGRVVTAPCANDALASLEESPADVLVSDHRMPGMSGIELMEAVRRRFPDTARVLMSANCDLESTADAINDGLIARFVLKPWRDEELRTVVRLALRDRTLLRQTRAAAQDLASLEQCLRFVPAAREAAPLLRSLRALLLDHERRIAWGA